MNETLALVLDRMAMALFLAAAALVIRMAIVSASNWRTEAALDGRPASSPLLRPFLMAFALGLMGFVMREGVAWHARQSARALLDPAASPRLTVAGKPFDSQQALIAALRSMVVLSETRSHATTQIPVEIASTRGSLQLELGRDSRRADEYWVKVPRYWTADDIARIHTGALDSF